LHRKCDTPLGIGLEILGHGCSAVLAVRTVLEYGAVREWNDTNRGYDVRQGDVVVEVNGLCGGAAALLEAAQRGGPMRLLVRRPLVC